MVRTREPGFDIKKIPYDDKKTYALISEGRTDGVFQLESKGMKQVLMRLCPDSIDDVIAAIALYRPGPMDSIPQYIERRHGRDKTEYKNPALEKILGKTYGCIVYQEQVMEIFREIAGYSLGGYCAPCHVKEKSLRDGGGTTGVCPGSRGARHDRG